MKKLFAGVLAALLAFGASAQADTLYDIRKAGKVRIAIDTAIPPFGMTDDKMQPTGSDIETAKLLAADWGLQFEHVPTTGASRIPSLQTGKADLVISTLSYTAERAKVIDFSKGYAVLRTVIAAPKSVNVKSLAELEAKADELRGLGSAADSTAIADEIARIEAKAAAVRKPKKQ